MVGFVIINDPNIKLSDLRSRILSELDEQQLQITGRNFKFLKKTFPVSSKQEKSMRITKICVNLSNTTNTLPNSNHTQPLPNRNEPILLSKPTSPTSPISFNNFCFFPYAV